MNPQQSKWRPIVLMIVGLALSSPGAAWCQDRTEPIETWTIDDRALEKTPRLLAPEPIPAESDNSRAGIANPALMPSFSGPAGGGPGYRATWYPQQSVSGPGNDFGLLRQSLAVGVPVWRGEGDMLLLTTGIRNTMFFTDAVLPDTNQPFPDELWNVNFGLMYRHQFANGWVGAVSTTLGSASDRPFASLEEMNVGFFSYLNVPARNERDLWTFSLIYSPTGNLVFPLPGVAYLWKPSDDLHVNLGIPFSLMWKPVDDLTLTFSYVPIINVNARASWQITQPISIYGGFEWLNEAYFLADRTADDDRFLVFEKRLITGVRWDFCKYAALDLNAGYAFDRYFGSGRSLFDDLRDRVDIGAGAFLGANLLVKW